MRFIDRLPILATLLILTGCAASSHHGDVAIPASAGAREQQKLGAVNWVQHSGERIAVYLQTFQLARHALEQAISPRPARPVIVADLDDTLLDSGPYQAWLELRRQEFTPETWSAWIGLALAEPTPGALEFLSDATTKQVEVFYVTNRKTNDLAPTLENLRRLHFPNPDPGHVLINSAAWPNKEACRRYVRETLGCNIVLLLGDNLGDFSADFPDFSEAERNAAVLRHAHDFGSLFIQFPNSMYGDYEKALYQNALASGETLKTLTPERKAQIRASSLSVPDKVRHTLDAAIGLKSND